MLKCNKMLWKLREVLSQLTANKLRFSLTVIGIAIGTMLYFLFSVLSYSFIESSYDRYESFADNTLLVYGELSREVAARVDDFFGALPSTSFYQSDSAGAEVLCFSVRDFTVSAAVSLTCTDTPCTAVALQGDGSTMMNRARIVAGRDFDPEDFQGSRRVVVIPEIAASLLYPGEDTIGKKLPLVVGGTETLIKTDYTVVGVYSNTPADIKAVRRIAQAKPEDNVNISFRLYAPLSALSKGERADCVRTASVYYSEDIDTLYSRASSFFEGYSSVSLFTKHSYFRMVDEINRTANSFLVIVMAVIVLISGISISNSMVFSVRERIPEIGIRKTFGADGCDIVNRFVLEGSITALVGVLFAVLTALLILLGVKYYTDSQLVPLFTVHFSWVILVKTFCFALLEGVVSSIVPAIYAAKIQIADAVRFD